ncbi:hypothetical protein TWF102_006996 [Orbilia oligospora]|uniref:Uncharacterized protein n=1 Tax=Orbilia oligospora TaxID=2813651 RepID=A0A7C8NX68_ORBOL|nr:hypothetical protein TWF103_005870 [Orbilia oligospora]KAF3111323.1 hypothetical protein TWF102_006996 [Orbilia oligospora]
MPWISDKCVRTSNVVSFLFMKEMRFYQVSSMQNMKFIESLVRLTPNLQQLFIEMLDPFTDPEAYEVIDSMECNLHYLIGILPFLAGLHRLHSIGLQKINFNHCKDELPTLIAKIRPERLTQLELLDCFGLVNFLKEIPATAFTSLRRLHIRHFNDHYPNTTNDWIQNLFLQIPPQLTDIFLILNSSIDLSSLLRHFGNLTTFVYDILPAPSRIYYQQLGSRKGVETFSKLSRYFHHMEKIQELGLTIDHSLFDEHNLENDAALKPIRALKTLKLFQLRNHRHNSYTWPISDFYMGAMREQSEWLYRGLLHEDAEKIASYLPSPNFILFGYNVPYQLTLNTYADLDERKFLNRILPAIYRVTKSTGFVSQVLPTRDEMGFNLRNRITDNTFFVNNWDDLGFVLPSVGVF